MDAELPAAIEERTCYCPHCGGPVDWPSPSIQWGESVMPWRPTPHDLANAAVQIRCYCGQSFRAVRYASQRLRPTT